MSTQPHAAAHRTPKIVAAHSIASVARQQCLLLDVTGEHAKKMLSKLSGKPLDLPKRLHAKLPHEIWRDAAEYVIDAMQRQALFWDTMRAAGNGFIEHERNGCPPVLAFDYEIILDGNALERPVNYKLIRITVPEGYPATDATLRPFVVIDPRAGHGAGIGGFKSDSEVGEALRARHPVYFVVFSREPEPGQTILDITAAERRFLEEIGTHHPDAPKPVVIGNCQGGWASVLLAATAPDLCGPLVLNGAPLSYWAGRTGQNPMRYAGGLVGGSWPALLLADLGNGRFDGAHLGHNFESLSPGNTWFRKYYDLYAKVDTEAPRFLEFERWWSGLFLMNGEEMRWIVENLFVGNRLSHGKIATDSGELLDMRAIRSPIMVFASEGDNITPPGQALHWIAEVYHDEQEIKALGQTIVYLLHRSIGHLGIFVSGAVARKEHHEIDSTLDVIEEVAPGLYEMRITGEEKDGYHVELQERTLADIRDLAGDGSGAEAFPALASISTTISAAYSNIVSPLMRGMATEATADLWRRLHPMRLRRTITSDANPAMLAVAAWADMVRRQRRPAAPDNIFVALEKSWADQIEHALDTWRDLRDATVETAFFSVYGWLAAFGVGQKDHRTAAQEPTSPANSERRRCLQGGYPEAVIRMMVLLARARGGVRREPLRRSKALLTTQEPFADMSEAQRHKLIQTQTALVADAPEESIAALTTLLPSRALREKALASVEKVAGPETGIGAPAHAMLDRLRAVLGIAEQRAAPNSTAA